MGAARAATVGRARTGGWLDRRSDRAFALLLFAPGLILVGLFVLPPILAVFGMSLFRIELARDDTWRFIGLNNFALRLPMDREVLAAIPRTMLFATLTTALTLPLALGAALVLKRPFRGRTVVAVALLLPWAVAPVVTGVFWRFIFTSQFGLANALFGAVGRRADELARGQHDRDHDRGDRVGVAFGAAAGAADPRGAPGNPAIRCTAPPRRTAPHPGSRSGG